MRGSARVSSGLATGETVSPAVDLRTPYKHLRTRPIQSEYMHERATISTMHFFISGQLDDKDVVRKAQQRLIDLGYRLTHDWTDGEDIRPRILESRDAGSRAARDITGVVEADLYILLSDNDVSGKGMYAELGAALALQQTRGKPRVCIVGRRNHPSVFYLHPAVEHFETLDCLIDMLERKSGERQH